MSPFLRLILVTVFLLAPIHSAKSQGFSTMFLQPPASTPIPALSDAAGRLYVIADPSGLAAATILYTSAALEGSKVVSATPIIISGLVVTTSSTAGYLMVWNQATVPADGAVTPALCFYIPSSPSSTGYAINFKGSTAASIAFSTTGCYSKTISATVTFMVWTMPIL